MKAKIKRLTLTVVAALALGGFAMCEGLISPEALLEYAGLAPDEVPFSLEDLEEAIELEQLTEEMVSGVPQILVEEGVEQIVRRTGKYDYSYLLEASESAATLTPTSALRRVAVFNRGETSCETLLVDLENDRVYYDGGVFMLDYVIGAQVQAALSADVKAAVEDIVLNGALPGIATSEFAGDQWGLCVETADGVMEYGGAELDEADLARASDAMLGLLNLFRES